MTWIEATKVLGRRPCTFVELDLDYCSKTYGVGTCPAVLGVSSIAKCYNTRRTCPVPAAYDPVARTYRFSNRELGPIKLSVPCLSNASFVSAKIDPAKSFGTRGSVKVTLQDFPWADRDVDKYVSSRTYDPEKQGTYFGKLLSRNPYYQNRAMRIYTGYLDEDGSIDLDKFQVNSYLIDKIEGPDGAGKVVFNGIEPLRLADDEKAQVPAKSNGALLADITNTDTTVTLTPTGIGNLEYPLFGVAAFDEEIVNFSRLGDVVTLNLRGALTTLPGAHTAGTTFQVCKVYNGVNLSNVLYELLTTYATVPAVYIDKPQWDNECATWLSGHILHRTIAVPTGVNVLINELIATCLFYIWWDPVNAKIPFRAIRPEDPALSIRALTDDSSFIADSISISENPDGRMSEVWVCYAQRNPLLKVDELRNYATIPVYLDADAESSIEYGERRVMRILCPWFSAANESQATVLGARLLARYRDNPRVFKFDLDAKDAIVQVGDVVQVTSKSLQGVTGAPITTLMQVLKRTEKIEGHLFTYELSDTFFAGRYAFILPTGTPDYLLATAAQRNKGCFICVTSTKKMPNGDDPYKII